MDPNKTQIAPQYDPNRTQMVADPNKTQTMGAIATKGLEVEVIPGRPCALANSPAQEQFLIKFIGAGGAFGGARTPLDICLVIDRSGSMEGEPLDYVKRACGHVVDLLSPDDILSIVTFEEAVDVLMPPRKVMNKDLIKENINRIVPGNTTNLYDGLSLAAQQVLTSGATGAVTRLIVFTDGEPTAGIKDYNALVGHVGEIKARGISCTLLGFGYDYNEELLAGMAKRAGGNYYFISRPELIPEVFRTELDKLMTMAARNLVLQLHSARWASIRQIYGHDIAFGQTEVEVALADVEKNMSLGLAIDFDFSNHPLGHYRIAAGRLAYDDAITGKNEIVDIDLVIEFTADKARCSVPQNPEVAQWVEVSRASRVVEKTVMGLKAGDITAAMAIAELQKTQMLLTRDGRTDEARQVSQAISDLKGGKGQMVEKTLIGTVTSLDQGKANKG